MAMEPAAARSAEQSCPSQKVTFGHSERRSAGKPAYRYDTDERGDGFADTGVHDEGWEEA